MRAHPVGGVWANPLQLPVSSAVCSDIFLPVDDRKSEALLSWGVHSLQMRQAGGMVLGVVVACRQQPEQRDGRERFANRPCFCGVCGINKLNGFLVGGMGSN